MRRLIKLKDAAQQLQIKVSTLRGWRLKRAHLEFVKVGGRLRDPGERGPTCLRERCPTGQLLAADLNRAGRNDAKRCKTPALMKRRCNSNQRLIKATAKAATLTGNRK